MLLQNSLHEERQRRIDCSQAYNSLFDQHSSLLIQYSDITNKNLLLHQELDDVRRKNNAYEAQECDQLLTCDSMGGDSDKFRLLEARIVEIEMEKLKVEEENSKMKEEHRNALINAAEYIIALRQTVERLEQSQSECQPPATPSAGKKRRRCHDRVTQYTKIAPKQTEAL